MEAVRHTVCGTEVHFARGKFAGQDEMVTILWCLTCRRMVPATELNPPGAVCGVAARDIEETTHG